MKLNLSKLKEVPQDDGPSVDATKLIEGLDADAHLPRALRRFIGTFQQLAKTEMGSTTFRAKVEALPKCFFDLAAALNNPSSVGLFMTSPLGWPLMSLWLNARGIDYVRIKELLELFQAKFNAPVDESDDLGRELIEDFLKPVLETMK